MRALMILVVLASASPAWAEAATGHATVVDGDTLAIDDVTFRLSGIDAPELDQVCQRDGAEWACGVEAADQLGQFIGQSEVACWGEERDQYGRVVAVCSIGRIELNSTMVEEGWATAFRQYSRAYIAKEEKARAAAKGIWSSSFTIPEFHRVAKQARDAEPPVGRSSRRAHRPAQGCTIKGNRSRRGEWIYHLPGMQYYDATRPEEIFCSEADAVAAGYRRSKV